MFGVFRVFVLCRVFRVFMLCRVFSVFPTINVAGAEHHLQLRPQELLEYEDQLVKVLRRYLRRLQWLLSGSSNILLNSIFQILENCMSHR